MNKKNMKSGVFPYLSLLCIMIAILFLVKLFENPIPIANINGTDIGPVVTPPESNAKGIISFFDINNIIINNI